MLAHTSLSFIFFHKVTSSAISLSSMCIRFFFDVYYVRKDVVACKDQEMTGCDARNCVDVFYFYIIFKRRTWRGGDFFYYRQERQVVGHDKANIYITYGGYQRQVKTRQFPITMFGCIRILFYFFFSPRLHCLFFFFFFLMAVPLKSPPSNTVIGPFPP